MSAAYHPGVAGLRGGLRSAVDRFAGPVIDPLGTKLLAPPRTVGGAVVLHGDRSRTRITLTFDDGPSAPATESMLDALDDVGVHATFFVLGEMVE